MVAIAASLLSLSVLRVQDGSDSRASSLPSRLTVESVVVGLHVDAKVDPQPNGTLSVLDVALTDSTARESVFGPVDSFDGTRLVVLGVICGVDPVTQWMDLQKPAEGQEASLVNTWVKVDLQRGSRVARRIRRGDENRRRAIAGVVTLVEGASEGGRRWVILDRELRAPVTTRIEVPEDLRTRSIQSLRSDVRNPGIRRGRRKDEDVTRGILQLGTIGQLGGTLDWRGDLRENHTFDEKRNRDDHRSRLRARVELALRPMDDLLVVASVKGEKEDRDVRNRDNEHVFAARFDETFIQMEKVGGLPLDLLAGRSRFEDDREWLYNRNLDGFRAFYQLGGLSLEGSVTTGFDLGNRYDNRALNLMGIAAIDLGSRCEVSAYVIDRRDPSETNESPFHYGLRSSGRPGKSLYYWSDLAFVSGVDGTSRLRGHAADLGATYIFETLPLKPNFTIGFAHGSGDRDPSDRTDGSFRQTGMQQNDGKFAGVTSFRYYGELMDPELSNLNILTVGAGARLFNKTSLDLVVHGYSQDVASTKLRNTNLKASPDGIHRRLGTGIDLILGIRELDALDVELTGGWFDPGAAFSTDQAAYTVKLQFRLKF